MIYDINEGFCKRKKYEDHIKNGGTNANWKWPLNFKTNVIYGPRCLSKKEYTKLINSAKEIKMPKNSDNSWCCSDCVRKDRKICLYNKGGSAYEV